MEKLGLGDEYAEQIKKVVKLREEPNDGINTDASKDKDACDYS
jgi:hypothetical protein